MYKLIIVDDEEVIRRALVELINWRNIGFQLVAAFEDGSEAISYIKDNPVDVILSDIKMARISGLDLAKYVYEHEHHTRIVIISGYKEFEYAKKAVDYNVEHYLLKPTKPNEVRRVFGQLKEKLDEEREKEHKIKRFQEKYEELLPILQDQFFMDLLMGVLRDENEIIRRIAFLDLKIDPATSFCVLMDVSVTEYQEYLNERWQYEIDGLNSALRNFLCYDREGISYYPVFSVADKIKVVAVSAMYDEMEHLVQAVQNHIIELQESIHTILGFDVIMFIRNVFQNMYKLAFYREPIHVEARIQESGKESELEQDAHQQLMHTYKLIMSNMNDGDEVGVRSLVDSFIEEISSLPIPYIQRLIMDLIAILINKFAELGLKIGKIALQHIDYQDIAVIKDIDRLRRWTIETLLYIMGYIRENTKGSNQLLAEKSKKFIEENYHKDISLDNVADHVFLNATYFSRIFKQSTGVNFSDYLTRTRLEHAKELYHANQFKTYEISEMVGYKSSNYFSRVFKLHTGYTPKEYCRIVLKRGDSADD